MAKHCTTRWAVRANAFNKVINNFGPLFKLWDICLGDKFDKETRSRILGCKSQMTEFRLFFGINLAYEEHWFSWLLFRNREAKSCKPLLYLWAYTSKEKKIPKLQIIKWFFHRWRSILESSTVFSIVIERASGNILWSFRFHHQLDSKKIWPA